MGYRLENSEIRSESNSAIGIKFPFNGKRVFNSTFTTLEQSESNLKNLLLTGLGERYELVEFGTSLKFLLFEQQTTKLQIAIDEEIRNSVNRWLPYINIEKIEVIFDTPLPNIITVVLDYTVSNIDALKSITISANESGQVTVE